MVKAFNREMVENLEIFFQLFNNMTDMVFVTTVENKKFSYILANEPAKKFVGLNEESFNKPIDEVLPYEGFKLVESKYIEAMFKKKPITYEDKMLDPGNGANTKSFSQFIYWESTITPVFNQDGNCIYMLAIVRDITERKMKERELKRVNDHLELVWNSAADAMYTFDTEENFVSVNKAFEALLGWTEEEILRDKSISIIPKDSKEDMRGIMAILKRGEPVTSFEVQRVTKEGKMIDVLSSYSPIYDQDGNWDGAVVVYKDITERNKIYQELLESEERFRLIADYSSDLITVLDPVGTILYASPSHLNILGINSDHYLNNSIYSVVHNDDRGILQNALKEMIDKRKKISFESRRLHSDGQSIWFHVIGTPICDEDGKVKRIIFQSRDISERKKYEEQLKQLALNDPLTGIPNRKLFSERLKKEMNLASIEQKILAVLLLDLDKFKAVNDTMGHHIGDELLKGFTERVKGCLRETDMMARLGGDEFAILMPNLNDRSQVIDMVNRILHSLQREWHFEHYSFNTTSSIGVAFYASPYTKDDKELLRNADIALYEAKEKGRNDYHVFHSFRVGQ